MLTNSVNIGNDCDVFEVQGTICRMLDCSWIISSWSSLLSVLSWSLSFLAVANFVVIIFNLSFVSLSSFYMSEYIFAVEGVTPRLYCCWLRSERFDCKERGVGLNEEFWGDKVLEPLWVITFGEGLPRAELIEDCMFKVLKGCCCPWDDCCFTWFWKRWSVVVVLVLPLKAD